jgi:hypothetical protein
MAYNKRWIMVAGVMLAAIGLMLLFSLLMEQVVESAMVDDKKPGRSGVAQAGLWDTGGAVTISGTFTVNLPLVVSQYGSPPAPFGVQMYGPVTYTTGLSQVIAAGARWIRVPIMWSSAEPENRFPQNYTWGAIDRQVRALRGENIEPVLILQGNPSWVADYAQGPVNNLGEMQQFVGALVERFDGDGYFDAPGSPVVRYWEFYNEPDNTDLWHAEHSGYGYFGYRGDEYAALLDAIYPAVKAANPSAQVVFGGVAYDYFDYEGGVFDPDFVDDVLSHCTGPCFDVMNFHYYPYYRGRWEPYGKDVIGKTRFFESKLDQYGLERPLVCTETTWPSASTWGSEALQSRYVAVVYARSLAAGLKLMNWYAWIDADSSLPGLLDNNLEPKPAYYAYQTLTEQLGKSRYLRPLSPTETGGGNIEGYVFNVPGPDGWGRLDVMWYDCPGYLETPPTNCPPGVFETVKVQAPALRVVSVHGNSGLLDDGSDGLVDGLVTVSVGPDPVYLRHLPANGGELP